MLNKLRNRIESGEKGFTLIELLVVILIIGILAAIAIPSFLNQRIKGQDACAKSMARTMQTAMETLYTENNSYATATPATLNAIENQIPNGPACGSVTNVATGITVWAQDAGCAQAAPGANNYCVSATSASTNQFFIFRSTTGVITRSCNVPASTNTGGCNGAVAGGADGTW